MKWITTPILRRFGFRQVLILNGLLCALSIGLCALLDADTPIVITLALLLVAGLTRSMQFTALSTLTFAEIEPQERSAATTLLSMLQQLALLIAVAFASLVLTSSQMLSGHGALTLADFRAAILATAGLAFISVAMLRRLSPDAGAELSERVRLQPVGDSVPAR
jgi:MFS family permease